MDGGRIGLASGTGLALVQSGSLIHSSKSSPPKGDFWTYFLDFIQLDLFWTSSGPGPGLVSTTK